MKTTLLLLLGILAGFMVTLCLPTDKALSYYKGSVIIAQDARHCTVTIDTKGIKNTVPVTNYEYKLYNLGDTIR